MGKFFFFCFNVKMVEFIAITKVEMEIHETQHLMVRPKPRLFWKEKSSKVIGGITPPKHHDYILQHAFCHK